MLNPTQYFVFSFVIYFFLGYQTAVAQDDQVLSTPDHTGFVNNQTCVSCHEKEAAAWQGSHHQQAMLPATDSNVLGDFNDVQFTDSGVTSRFFKKDGKFFINTPNAEGSAEDFEVKYTFGIDPLQQYLLSLPKGKFQAFTVAWDVKKKRWFDLYPDEKVAASDPAHWTARAFTANSSCMECHMTNMSLNHDAETGTYDTQWSEVNVSCQSCHGPGEKHLEWAAQEGANKESVSAEKTDDINKGLAVDYQALNSKQQVETCARCHSRRFSVSENDAHGRSLYDDFMPELIRQGVYHADGQVLEEDYVYGSFIQSKMHKNGVTCMDCHEPHSLKLRKEGNALCTTCHQQTAPKERFASLSAKQYDSPAHHFHEEKSAGAQCVNCHMPETTYMQIDPRRDHSFSIPRPDISGQWGTPNACTGCHSDESAAWATAAMNKWYEGEQWQQRPNIAGTISKGRAGVPQAYQPLLEMVNDQQQPAIIRATAIHLLTRYGQKSQKTLLAQLASDSPLIRATSIRGLNGLPPEQKAAAIVPLLSDTVQGVRVAAANMLLNVPASLMNAKEISAFERALEEYKGAQLAQSDHPEGHFNLGNLYAIRGDAKAAEKAYRTAIKQDPRFLPAYTNLAHFYYQTGRSKEAEESFREAILQVPQEGSLYYSLALLLTDQKRLEEALPLLAKASELLPQDVRVHYNYGLLLQRLKQPSQAVVSLEKALTLAPTNKRVLQALAALYQQQGDTQKLKDLIKRSSAR